MRLLSLVTVALMACGNDIQVAKGSSCDGTAEGGEATVDAPYDADEDGFFDASNPDCAATYAADRLDCNDQDPAIHPGAVEAVCNGLDDDCNPDTPDAEDLDSDGSDSCDDCDEGDPLVNPGVSEVACNGVDDDCDSATPDAVDADSDGIDACSDCNDGDPAINPSREETTCNGVDDDCDDTTPDAPDSDSDGVTVCTDCNDSDPSVSPSATEVCWNEVDDDCDGRTDEDCEIDYTDTWTIDSTITYRCASGAVSIDFSQVIIAGPSTATTVTNTTGTQPGRMSGAFSTPVDLDASRSLAGGCTEDYYFTVEFTDANHFVGTFLAQYTPAYSRACADCTNQGWSISGSR